MGGSVDVGDSYASNFLVISPQEKLTEGEKKFSVTLKVDSSMSGTVTVYKADKDNPQWRKVDADIDDGVAKMQVDSGKSAHVDKENASWPNKIFPTGDGERVQCYFPSSKSC